MSECLDDLKAKLKQAKDAYHELMTGTSVRVFVDQNGERVEYTAANAARLSSYIRQLEKAISSGNCNAFGDPSKTGPIGFYF